MRHNQAEIRTENYQGLFENIENRGQPRNPCAGNIVALSSNFAGSPRNAHQLLLDAMTLVAKKRKPDFI